MGWRQRSAPVSGTGCVYYRGRLLSPGDNQAPMLHLPVYRWGEPYRSMEVEPLTHFATGQAVAEMSQANGGLVERDMRHASRARQSLRGFRATDLLGKLKQAADLFLNADLP